MSIEIIAELGQGFEGSNVQAKLLLKAAANSGADSAKFQMVFADELATADYKYYQLFKSLEMSDDVWLDLAVYAKNLGIKICFDIFGVRSLKLAENIGAHAIKLHGTDISNIALLKDVAASGISKVILGAGGANLNEIDSAISIINSKNIVVLLGFQSYPTPNETNNIRRVQVLLDKLVRTRKNVSIGFADHTTPDGSISLAIPAMAIGAGATILEKHLTLGKVMCLEDFESALNPDEFLEFTNTMRACYSALGEYNNTNDFDMSMAEQSYRKAIRRHVVANRHIEAGTVLVPQDLELKRSSSEVAITELSSVYNKKVERDIEKNQPLISSDFLMRK